MNIPAPEAINFRNGVSPNENWKKFANQWKNFEVATGLKEKPKEVRLATFMCVIGVQGQEKYESLSFQEGEDKEDLATVILKFEECCKARSNVIVERYRFLQCKQSCDETIDEFLARLRKLASSCEYESLEDDVIRDQLILNAYDHSQRNKLLDKVQLEGKVPKLL